jgi:hypothetical protein
MNAHLQSGRRHRETGSALLIAIFALLLISVVGIALLVSTGTDSALAGNYRTSTSAYYAGVAGLEEARGRLLWKNPNYINITNSYSNLLAPAGPPSGVAPVTWGLKQVMYIINPGPGETVDPTSANPANYPDSEYVKEFPSWGLGGSTVQQIPSVSPAPTASPALPGPSYKWVRINAVTEQSLNMDVNGDGVYDPTDVLFYDPARVDPTTGNPAPSLVLSSPTSIPPTPTSVQALEITALAVAPNGSRRILQYVVAPLIISPDAADQNFPAALILDGFNVTFQPPSSPNYQVSGVDACNPSPPLGLPLPAAIGSIDSTDYTSILGEVTPNNTNYPGAPLASSPFPPGYTPTTPSLSNLGLPPPNNILRQSWLTPATLDAVMQDITNSADLVVNGSTTATEISNLAPGMSATNPMTIVVNGNLNLNSFNFTGYGLLLVTGTLRYDPNTSWNGIVLVVGQGIFTSSGTGGGGFDGTVFLAQTRDSSGNLLPALGQASYSSQSSHYHHHGYGSSGYEILYNSCSINNAQGPLTYKVLSFHEIAAP